MRWLRAHHADLDDPDAPDLAALRRLLAHSRFHELRDWAHARFADTPNHQDRQSRLAERIAAVPADDILPAPFVTGDDLTARGVTPGPIFKTVLDKLYEAQLNLELRTRDAALARLAEELKSRR